MSPRPFRVTLLIIAALLTSMSKLAQSQTLPADSRFQKNTSISTAVPFLLIAPDARGAAMGDNGVATEGDANSMHWNPAKYAFAPYNAGISLSYTPWLSKLIGDMNQYYIGAYTKLNHREILAGSIRYFSYGNLDYTDNEGNNYGQLTPSDLALDLSYIRKLNDHFSIAIAARYIHSARTQSNATNNTLPGNAAAADMALYYSNEGTLFNVDGTSTFGLNISNIGTKLSYGNGYKAFLPANLRVGAGENFHFDDDNSLSFNLELNKLLVPSAPVTDIQGNILKGNDPTSTSTLVALFRSFSDAPSGLKGELQEIAYSLGSEYNYRHQFFLRAGYFYQNPLMGNRQYLELGAGFKYHVLDLDLAYVVAEKANPLSNTLRFSLNFYFGDIDTESAMD